MKNDAMVELVDTADLKSAGESREGSSPSSVTPDIFTFLMLDIIAKAILENRRC